MGTSEKVGMANDTKYLNYGMANNTKFGGNL